MALVFGYVFPDEVEVEDANVLSPLQRVGLVREVVIHELALLIVRVRLELLISQETIELKAVLVDSGKTTC
jgi:hypothetical protein